MAESPGSLIAEIDHTTARVAATAALDAKRELVDNTYPLIKMVVEGVGTALLEHEQRLGAFDQIAAAMAQRIDELDGAIAELVSETESILQPDLASEIDEVLSAGLRLASGVEELVAKFADADSNPDTAGAAEEVRKLVAEYRSSVDELRDSLDAVTIADPEEEKEDGDAA